MRWVLTRRTPRVNRILLIESGPREVAEKLLPRLAGLFGPDVPVDLATCLPEGFPAPAKTNGGRVWRVASCRSHGERWRVLREIRAQRHAVAAVLCADTPIMASWRAAALLLLPSKFLIVNENADFFWLDRGSWRLLLKFLLIRKGLYEETAARTLARILAFPFTLAYLLAYAGWVHLRRAVRLLLRLGPRRRRAA